MGSTLVVIVVVVVEDDGAGIFPLVSSSFLPATAVGISVSTRPGPDLDAARSLSLSSLLLPSTSSSCPEGIAAVT